VTAKFENIGGNEVVALKVVWFKPVVAMALHKPLALVSGNRRYCIS